MSDIRYTHTDNDGDRLVIRAGMFGATIDARSHFSEEQVEVAVRYEHLPALIESLRGILDEAAL